MNADYAPAQGLTFLLGINMIVVNDGTAAFEILDSSGTIGGAASIIVVPGESVLLWTDSETNWDYRVITRMRFISAGQGIQIGGTTSVPEISSNLEAGAGIQINQNPETNALQIESIQGDVQIVQTNHIINGNFDLWQRGSTYPAVAHFDRTADRWVWGQSAGTAVVTVSKSTDVPPNTTAAASLDMTVTTANATPASNHEAHLRYGFEGRRDITVIKSSVCIFSFWVKASKSGQYSVELVKLPDNLGAGGTWTYIAPYTINIANTWERKTFTVNFADAPNPENWYTERNLTLKLRFSLYAGSTYQAPAGWHEGNFVGVTGHVNLCDTVGAYMRLSQVQMVNTSSVDMGVFYAKTIGDELRDAQRYCLLIGSEDLDCVGLTGYAGIIGDAVFSTILYPCTMRRVPTVFMGSFTLSSGQTNQPIFQAGTQSGCIKMVATITGRVAARSGTIIRPILLDAEMYNDL